MSLSKHLQVSYLHHVLGAGKALSEKGHSSKPGLQPKNSRLLTSSYHNLTAGVMLVRKWSSATARKEARGRNARPSQVFRERDANSGYHVFCTNVEVGVLGPGNSGNLNYVSTKQSAKP